MNNFDNILKQAQKMQAKLLEAQNRMNDMEIYGSSGGAMVNITINGKGEIKKITIDPKLMTPDDTDVVCDLIIAAHNDAKSKLEAKMAEEMGGLVPPGMKLPF